ncbi:MAG: hypothetical protein ABI333_04395 [bacterium]
MRRAENTRRTGRLCQWVVLGPALLLALQLDERVTVIPVYTWNLGGAAAGVDSGVMKMLFDKAPETILSQDVWSWGHVDEVWDQCLIQFRHMGHSDILAGYPCWIQPVVSNRSSMVSTWPYGRTTMGCGWPTSWATCWGSTLTRAAP